MYNDVAQRHRRVDRHNLHSPSFLADYPRVRKHREAYIFERDLPNNTHVVLQHNTIPLERCRAPNNGTPESENAALQSSASAACLIGLGALQARMMN